MALNNHGDCCQVCDGARKLRVAVLLSTGRIYKLLSSIDCEECNGTGKIETALSRALESYRQ